MKKLIVTAAILMFAAVSFAQTADWFQGNFTEAKNAARKGDINILVDFFSDG